MPSTVISPAAPGTYSQQGLRAGATKLYAYQNALDDAACCYSDGSDWYESFGVSIPSNLAAISAHTLSHRASRYTAWDGTVISSYNLLRYSSADHLGSATAIGADNAWHQYDSANLGSATLTRAQANTVEIGTRLNPASANELRACYARWSITYSIYPQGFVEIIGALGPLAALLLSEMPAIARAAWRRTGQLILPAEYPVAWREMREARRLVLV